MEAGGLAVEYVVVGAGSAGCVLASRLSEAGARVLLVEAGPERRPENTFDPVLWPTEVGGAADWGYETPPQPGMLGRRSPEPHGFMVGGSSSLNGMMWTRGDPSDFEAWAHGGAPGWGYEDLLPYFRRAENCVDDPDPEMGHGGPVYLQHRGFRDAHPAAKDFVAAAEAMGMPREETFDGRSGMVGAGFFACNVKDGRRFGAREAYLLPALERENLVLWPDARAMALVFEGSRCVGVSVSRGTGAESTRGQGAGAVETVRASEGVVLAASTAESPKLLMLSGIGPEGHLRGMGIPLRQALPGVGANLHDHVMCVLRYEAAGEIPEAEFAWEAGAFYRSSPGWVGPDLETIFNPTAFDRQLPGEPPMGITMVTALLRPMSRGTVRLASADPLARPALDPRFLSAPSDVERLATAVRTSLALSETEPLAGWISGLGDNPGLDPSLDDVGMHAWVRANALSQYHMAGTCKMGLDGWSVVDPELRVYGIENLRVCDASVMPRVVSGHCQAAVLAIAERASDLLLGRAVLTEGNEAAAHASARQGRGGEG